jgi:hypothetical protein
MMEIDPNLHNTLNDGEIIKRLGVKPDAYKKNKDLGNCVGCGLDMFFDTHGNVLILDDRSVLHACETCIPKLSKPAAIVVVQPEPVIAPSKKKKEDDE